jgi:hypothetical protein
LAPRRGHVSNFGLWEETTKCWGYLVTGGEATASTKWRLEIGATEVWLPTQRISSRFLRARPPFDLGLQLSGELTALFRIFRKDGFEFGISNVRRRRAVAQLTILASLDKYIQLYNRVFRGHASLPQNSLRTFHCGARLRQMALSQQQPAVPGVLYESATVPHQPSL